MAGQWKYKCPVCGKVTAGRAPRSSAELHSGVQRFTRVHNGNDGQLCPGSSQVAVMFETRPRFVWRCAKCQAEYTKSTRACKQCQSQEIQRIRLEGPRWRTDRIPQLDERGQPATIEDAIIVYLQGVKDNFTPSTRKMYGRAMEVLAKAFEDSRIPLNGHIESITELAIDLAGSELAGMAPATRQLYLVAMKGFYEYLLANDLKAVNLVKLEKLVKRHKKGSTHMRTFSQVDIEKVIAYALSLNTKPSENAEERLRNLRDRALIVTLADTGLRIHEACNLLRGDVDQDEGKAIIIGKGSKQAVIRFTHRSIQAIRDYLSSRARLDGSSGRPLSQLPVFLRHDHLVDARQKRVQFRKLSTGTGRAIVEQRVLECLGPDKAGTITPHSFRHFFVTTILKATGNLKVAQELARHSDISTTNRYAHLTNLELDKAFRQALEPGEGSEK